jgi:FMN phosphatase YigB (HAD superfamily)
MLDFSISAGSLGTPKPNPAAFLEAAKLAGVGPKEIVHVGDDYTADVTGARAAGASTCMIVSLCLCSAYLCVVGRYYSGVNESRSAMRVDGDGIVYMYLFVCI